MSTYGRNVSFRVPPVHGERAGRFVTPTTGDPIPIGAPVKATVATAPDALGLQVVELVTSAGAPLKGLSGIMVYEYGPAAYAGDDPMLTTYSDKGTAPLGAAVQVVSGPAVKVVFKNTAATVFLGSRTYAAFTMIAGFGATPTLAVGDFVGPGPGNSTSGYWQESTSGNAWLVVTGLDTLRGEVECRMLF